MGKIKGFLDHKRQAVGHRPIAERVLDFGEMDIPLSPDALVKEAARCMDCGIPFCHGSGCPLGNRIPEFNELIYRGQWRQACENLHATNNFPEITGRVCPAPCETSCTLGVNDEPVSIRHIEFQIVERGFQEGWITPFYNGSRTGKRIAVIGSGPAGLAAAQQLARAGHDVVVFEKDEQPGGLLRYGIPDFKLAKCVIDRRLEQLRAEGVSFQTGVKVGEDVSARYLRKLFDGICLTMGAGQPRDLNIPGRGYEHIHFAMEFLGQQNRLNAGERIAGKAINARDKAVVVIGGGDTGSDCVGTARRQGAREIHQLEILPKPPERRPADTPWPTWPRIMRTSTSHEEGCERRWGVMTRQFIGRDVSVAGLHCVEVEWLKKNDEWKLKEIAGTDFELKADLVLIAMGFVHVEHGKLIEDLGLKLDARGNAAVDRHQTSEPDVFAAGDTVSGASLVVRAIDSGRGAAAAIDAWLTRKD
ncbi:MAG: glutamate synthase subunit beta [Phycisphaerae bacterium]|nr:glutamate synthase subunit beta [Phycisphaerae bacterium]